MSRSCEVQGAITLFRLARPAALCPSRQHAEVKMCCSAETDTALRCAELVQWMGATVRAVCMCGGGGGGLGNNRVVRIAIGLAECIAKAPYGCTDIVILCTQTADSRLCASVISDLRIHAIMS